uniref:Uncharacterized protein n=1 Tax=Tetranychus urticae TaxID=32264 RepID=T1K548_TETUR
MQVRSLETPVKIGLCVLKLAALTKTSHREIKHFWSYQNADSPNVSRKDCAPKTHKSKLLARKKIPYSLK